MAELRADFPAETESEADAAPAEARAAVEPEAAAPVRPAREREAPVRTAPERAAPEPAAVEPVTAAHVEPEVVATPIPHAPQVIASFAPPPATYNVVSEHEKVTEEPNRPVRRRRHEAAPPVAEPLQLVETANERIVAQPVFEDEAPRPPVRRRRRGSGDTAPAEPLQLVETDPAAKPAAGGSPQA